MDVDSTISLINKNWKQRSKWNSFVNSVVGSKYSKFKKTWKKADKEAVKIIEILDDNGVPKPKSDYYFPYEKYSDLIWELFAECPTN